MAGYARVSVRQPLCGKQNSNMALKEQNKLLKDKLQLNAEYLNIDLKLNRKNKVRRRTCGMFYCRDSGYFSVNASYKLSCSLTGECFEIATNHTSKPL